MAIYGWPVVKRLSGIETVPVSGELADFVIATDGTLHAVDGGVPSQVSTAAATVLADDAVTYAKIQNVTATDKILGRSTAGAGDVEEITCTAAGRALIDDVDAAAQRTTLGLGTLATLSTITSANITDLTIGTVDIADGAVTGVKLTADGAKGTRSSDQSIPNNSSTAIAFTGEAFDTATYHDNTTNNSRFTAPRDGKYRMDYVVQFATSSTGTRQVGYKIDGGSTVVTSRQPASASGMAVLCGSTVVSLTAAQYVEFFVLQDRGSSLDITNETTASLMYLGA